MLKIGPAILRGALLAGLGVAGSMMFINGLRGAVLAVALTLSGTAFYTAADAVGRKTEKRDGRWLRRTITSNMIFSAILAGILTAALRD